MKNDFAIVGNRTGFNNDNYNTIIDNAFKAADPDAQASLLHDAEKALLAQMPIIPVVFNQNFAMHQKDISGLSNDYAGYFDLKEVMLKDYLNSDYYKTEEDTSAQAN